MSVVGRLVAVRFLNGDVLKGRTADFKPFCATFLVRHEDGKSTRVDTRELKAVFFIKTVAGNPQHRETKEFSRKTLGGKQVWVEFKDGEELAGWATAFASGKNGFFFAPTDPEANAERVFVFHSALRQFRIGPAAEQAAEEYKTRPGKTGETTGASGAKPPRTSETSGAGKVWDIE